MFSMLIGSPSSLRIARFRALYLKQYLTPTMILSSVRGPSAIMPFYQTSTHQRFVKTTPNPSATKKRRDDEFPPLLSLLPPWVSFPAPGFAPPFTRVLLSAGEAPGGVEGAAVGDGEPVALREMVAGVGVAEVRIIVAAVSVACLTTTRAASNTTGLMYAMFAGDWYMAQ
jgi:hypothetical protein